MFEDSDEGHAPFRVVGFLSEQIVRAGDLMEAVEKAVARLPDEDPAASLSILPFGAPDEAMHAFRAVMRPGDKTEAAEALVRVFRIDDPQSPHAALIDKLVQLGDAELTAVVMDSAEDAVTFVEIAMGKLDHQDRIQPFLSFVKIVAQTMKAVLVDPSSAVVGDDVEDWLNAARMSIAMELALPALGDE